MSKTTESVEKFLERDRVDRKIAGERDLDDKIEKGGTSIVFILLILGLCGIAGMALMGSGESDGRSQEFYYNGKTCTNWTVVTVCK